MTDRTKEKAVLCYYDELLPIIEDCGMSDSGIVRVLVAWLRWARDGEMPVLERSDEKVLFTMLMKQTLRDRERREASVENGKKGGRPRKLVPEPMPEPEYTATAGEQSVLSTVPVPSSARAELRALTQVLPDELVQHAVDEAVSCGKASWKYVRSILERYRDRGFRTREDVNAADAHFRSTRGRGRPSPQDGYQHHEYTEADFADLYYDPKENRFGEMEE